MSQAQKLEKRVEELESKLSDLVDYLNLRFYPTHDGKGYWLASLGDED